MQIAHARERNCTSIANCYRLYLISNLKILVYFEQARRQDLAAGGAKNQKEGQEWGATFLKCSIGYMQQPVGQT